MENEVKLELKNGKKLQVPTVKPTNNLNKP